MDWNDRFLNIFRACVERYHMNSMVSVERFFLPDELIFLSEIGHQPAEMHAYIQEFATKGAPSPSTILLIAAARRSFFLTNQRGISGNATPIKESDLPPENEELQEIPYLSRIIRKAEAKLFGTLDARVVYGDAKDAVFLQEHGNIHPADFLYLAWNARGDKQKIVTAVLNAMKATPAAQQSSPHAGQEVKTEDSVVSTDPAKTTVQRELNLL